MRRSVKLALGAVIGVGLLLGVGAWTLLRVEDIPETLEAPEDPDTVVIPGIGDQPDLALAELRGKRAFFVMVGIASWSSEEGRKLNRALNRWVLPADTEGYIVFDAEGLGVFAENEKSAKYMKVFGKEVRFPMYGDFEGRFRKAFKLAQGHHGLVVLGPDGEVNLRRSGGIDDPKELEVLREMLGAEEPPPGPPVPDFELGLLSDEACAARPCAVLFLGEPVARGDVPGIDDGFEGEREQVWAQMEKPAVRLVSSALKLDPEDKALAAIVGSTPGLEPESWVRLEEAPIAREAFEVAPDETVLLVLRHGRVAFRSDGVVPMYRMGEVSDLLDVEFDFED